MQTARTLQVIAAAFFMLALAACARTGTAMNDEGAMMDEKPMMDRKADGMFTGTDGHMAAGTAEITEGMDGEPVLTLRDIHVDEVPDGHVYLAKDGDWKNGVEVGRLKQFTGTVAFALPMGVDPHDYDSVVIWCKKFNVEIGRAYLPKKTM